jgi:hypothetical protein
VRRPMSQTVGHPILTTESWFEPRAAYVGFAVEKISLGMAFTRVLGIVFLNYHATNDL